ncbi:MAG: isoprenylcysteine carboxylmethyltransferase family protein [Spirochaetales bacterium]|nr:isoprenylcysteine carboxylmethyltransferase family protein [Spirochaetales bacterium]
MSLQHGKSKNWYADDNKERNDLTKEHPFGDSGQLMLAVIFLLIWLADSFILRWTVFLQSSLPLYASLSVGVLIAAAACYLVAKAHQIVFKEVRRPPAVIEKSVFKMVRHPMYLGMLLFFLAFVAATLSLAALGFWLIMFFFYNYIAAYEEKMLEKKFGERYLAYKHRVARWMPGVW